MRQAETHNHVYVPWDQHPEIPNMPTVRAQVVQLIPYLSNKQLERVLRLQHKNLLVLKSITL